MGSILPWLQLSRAFLPFQFWKKIENAFWESYWRREEQALGADIAVAPSLNDPGLSVFETLKTKPLRESERAVLVESIARQYPFKAVLEIGCAYGQSLHVIAPLFPNVNFIGLDIAPDRVSAGNELLQTSNFNNVRLIEGSMENLSGFEDKSVDLIFSCASLLYISDEKIERVLFECKRVAKSTLLFVEQNAKQEQTPIGSTIEKGFLVPAVGRSLEYWARDYSRLCGNIFGKEAVETFPIISPRFQTEQWQTSAALVKVSL